MPTNRTMHRLRQAALLQESDGLSDAHLLECFLDRRDEAAFEALVRRHGPMVLGVCRRILGHSQEVDDAFQCTVLVFVQKAASIRSRASLGGWLYSVAYRTALQARAARARRREQETPMVDVPQAEPEPAWPDLLARLDRELSRLPEKYRVPVVLCDLEGRSRREAAHQLRLPEGTLSSRLAMARKLLARRLTPHGPLVSAGALAAALTRTASAAVPGRLLRLTVHTSLQVVAGTALTGVVSAPVVSLTEGVLRVMLLSKLKGLVLLVVMAVLGTGVVGLRYHAGAAEPPKVEPSRAARAVDELEELRLEIAALRTGLQLLRERVKVLEGPRPADAAQLPRKAELRSGLVDYYVLDVMPLMDGDPQVEAEAALKALREHPDDRGAADALIRALKKAKERQKLAPAKTGDLAAPRR